MGRPEMDRKKKCQYVPGTIHIAGLHITKMYTTMYMSIPGVDCSQTASSHVLNEDYLDLNQMSGFPHGLPRG